MNDTFDISARGLSLVNARVCVQASAEAYDAEPTIRDVVTDTNIVVRQEADCIIIAARGTKSLKNFVTDAEAWRTPMMLDGQKVEVHSGFFTAAAGVLDLVQSRLALMQYFEVNGEERLPLVFTGHSLGGALAVLLAVMLRNDGWQTHSIYTFGQPRVGNRAFAKFCDAQFGDRHFRFEDGDDIVSRIPLPWRYWHSGQDIFLPCFAGAYQVNPLFGWKFIEDALEVFEMRAKGAFVLDEFLEDHHISKYAAKVNAL